MTSRANDSSAESPVSESGLEARLREANEQQLIEILDDEIDRLSPSAVRVMLRNPFVGEEAIRRVARLRELTRAYEVRRDLVFHPKTPQVLARQLLPTLGWRDLARLSTEVRTHPLIRRQAESTLAQRQSSLALGEKISLARIAGTIVLQELRWDPSPRVFEALLQNPRMTEGLLVAVVRRDSVPPGHLAALLSHPRWGSRYELRRTLVRHPRLDLGRALGLLPSLLKTDLAALARDSRLRGPIRRRAALLSGKATRS